MLVLKLPSTCSLKSSTVFNFNISIIFYPKYCLTRSFSIISITFVLGVPYIIIIVLNLWIFIFSSWFWNALGCCGCSVVWYFGGRGGMGDFFCVFCGVCFFASVCFLFCLDWSKPRSAYRWETILPLSLKESIKSWLDLILSHTCYVEDQGVIVETCF